MGNKSAKIKIKEVKKDQGVDELDIIFLGAQTGYSRDKIISIYDEFIKNNPNGKMNKSEFVQLYSKLRNKPQHIIQSISLNAFKVFDTDNDGFITFNEFLISFA